MGCYYVINLWGKRVKLTPALYDNAGVILWGLFLVMASIGVLALWVLARLVT